MFHGTRPVRAPRAPAAPSYSRRGPFCPHGKPLRDPPLSPRTRLAGKLPHLTLPYLTLPYLTALAGVYGFHEDFHAILLAADACMLAASLKLTDGYGP